MSVSFNSSGSTYLFSALSGADLPTYPCWIAAWVRPHSQIAFGGGDYVFDNGYSIIDLGRTTDFGDYGVGLTAAVDFRAPMCLATDATTLAFGVSASIFLRDPYWDHLLVVFTSPTSRSIYLNGILVAVSTTSADPDFSAGSPQVRIGIRGDGNWPFYGLISNVTYGQGTLSPEDRQLLATIGGDYYTIPSILHWWPLDDDATDSVGSLDLTESGSVSWSAINPVLRTPFTRSEYIQYIFNTPLLPSTTPTVTTGVSSPLTTVSGYASVERFDVSFPDIATSWNASTTYTTRLWHYIAPGSPTHVVFIDDGHGPLSVIDDPDGSGGAAVINAILAAGISVVQSLPPGFNAFDNDYATGEHHVDYWPYLNPGIYNPLVRWLHPLVAAMNNVAPRYAKRSVIGLSGGGWQAPRFAVLDTRINHAIVPIRGILASRALTGDTQDFEQNPYPNGCSNEELFAILAADHHRLWFVNHPNDPTGFSRSKDPTSTSAGGSYQSVTYYVHTYIDPICRSNNADILFIEDEGPSPHKYTTWTLTNVIIPALTEPLSISSDLPDNCQGWWPLNEESGTIANDGSPAGHDGTYVGSPSWITSSLDDNLAPDFNGSSQYVMIDTSPIIVGWPVTMAAWFTASSGSIHHVIALSQTAAGGGDNFAAIDITNSPFQVRLVSATDSNYCTATATPILENDKLYFAVAVFESNIRRTLYLYDEFGYIGTYFDDSYTDQSPPVFDHTDLATVWYNGTAGYLQYLNGSLSWAGLWDRAFDWKNVDDLWITTLNDRAFPSSSMIDVVCSDTFTIVATIDYEIDNDDEEEIIERTISSSLTLTHIISTSHVANYTINQSLGLTQTYRGQGRTINLAIKSGANIDVIMPEVITIESLDDDDIYYRISKYITYTVSDTVENIRAFKTFLNYYRNEYLIIDDYTDIYEAKLDLNQNNQRYLDIFQDDTTIIVNFYAIKVN